jgi:flagellar hook-length control protein FliK
MDAAKDAEEDGDADTEAARETAASDSYENKTQFTAPALPVETNDKKVEVETNGKTENDIKNSSDEPAERTAQTEKNAFDLTVKTNDKVETNGNTEDDVKKSSAEPAEHSARTEKNAFDLTVETSDKVEVETNGETEEGVKKSSDGLAERLAHAEKGAFATPAAIDGKTEAGAKKLADAQSGGAAAEDASSGTRPGESQNTGADELPDTDISDNAKNTDHKDEPGVPKAASRAAGTAQRAGGQEDAASGKAFQEGTSREKPSSEPQISAANPFAGQARAETAPLAQAQVPAVYTLMSADKFGEGLRSVMTIMTRDGAAEARIVVEPPALGRVDISLRASESGVEANFKVDNEELRQMVQKQLDSLKESLSAQGIHVSGITVDIKNNEGEKGRGKMGASKKSRRLNPGAADEAEENIGDGARILRLDLEQGLLHWVA